MSLHLCIRIEKSFFVSCLIWKIYLIYGLNIYGLKTKYEIVSLFETIFHDDLSTLLGLVSLRWSLSCDVYGVGANPAAMQAAIQVPELLVKWKFICIIKFGNYKPKAVLHAIIAAGTPTPAVTDKWKISHCIAKSNETIFTCSESESCSSVASDDHGIASSLADTICKWTWRDRWSCQQQNNENCSLHDCLMSEIHE